MGPVTTSFLAAILAHAGKKAFDLGQVFVEDTQHGQSKFKRFLQKLYQKPLTWIFAILFSPFILTFAIVKTLRDFSKDLRFVVGVKIVAMLIGFCLASIAALIAGSYVGTIAGIFLIKDLFGWSAAISFVLGTTFSVTCTVIFQIIVFNLMCFMFLKITKNTVIESVYEEYIENREDVSNVLPPTKDET